MTDGANDDDTVTVHGGSTLRGSVRTPGDKSISHRALLLSCFTTGTSTITGLSNGEDVASTMAAVVALGAGVHHADTLVHVDGGRDRLHPPSSEIDCGNSGTGMRLLAGFVAGLDGETVLRGDASLSSRPMDRIAEPLRAMGAEVDGVGERSLPPLHISGGSLHGIEWTTPVASAQIKSAILFAALWAEGDTVIFESVATRAHTEEMLATAGAHISVTANGQGRTIRLGPSELQPATHHVPGDPSQAAFWVVGAGLIPGSSLRVADVYAGAERLGFLHVLRRMGAKVTTEPSGTTPELVDLITEWAPLHATSIEAAEIPSLDEVPILAVAAATAEGITVFRDVGELRVKEVDRLAAVATLVRSLGAEAEVVGDDLSITGVGPTGSLRHTTTRSGGDHRMAMAAAIGALAAGPGSSEIGGFSCVATSYPGFLDDLARLSTGRDPSTGPTPAPARSLRIIAIDGPAGSGKSTVSRAVAGRLGLARLDTGGMYRAVAWASLDRGIDTSTAQAIADIARDATIETTTSTIAIDGTDVTDLIRSPEVSRAVSIVAANPHVRSHLVEHQRRWAGAHGGGVIEGRDIGTVVFPEAALKIYLTASPEERARRRNEEGAESVARRDRIDSTRAASPLTRAENAVLIDTTGRSVDDVTDEILSRL